jgi:CheY-specific phosphatase CheX
MQASDFTPIIGDCCAEVLDAMYFAAVLETRQSFGPRPDVEEDRIGFNLHFQGDVHGWFGVQLSPATARTLASNFLGEEEDALSLEEVREVVGELTNMLCGSLASRVEGRSKFVLSHPEPTTSDPAPMQDALISDIDTDLGPIRTWVALDPNQAMAETSNEDSRVHP